MIDLKTNSSNILFQLALGLQSPWQITKIDFSKEEGQLNIYLSCSAGARFQCSTCQQEIGVHDVRKRVWKHLNFFQYETYLHADLPRIKCSKCKNTKNVSVPWARPNSGFTLLFEAFAMELAQAMPMSNVEEITNENDTRLMRIIEHYVNQAREKMDMSQISKIGTDETSKTKGHNYITTFIDFKERKVLFATEGKDCSTVERFKKDFEAHGGKAENIEQACCDLSKAFVKGIKEQLPNAEIVFDRFHVMSKVTKALDEVRRQEQINNPILSGSRYVWLHNPETTNAQQKERLTALSGLNLKTARAYQIRLTLRDIFDTADYIQAQYALKKWYFWATHSRLNPIIKAARTIRNHWQGILNFFKDRMTNGLAEGINSIIQTIKRRARGYRNVNNFITMIYLVLSNLNFNLPEVTGLATHHR